MLLVDDAILINESRAYVNKKLGLWRNEVKKNGLKISKIMMIYEV